MGAVGLDSAVVAAHRQVGCVGDHYPAGARYWCRTRQATACAATDVLNFYSLIEISNYSLGLGAAVNKQNMGISLRNDAPEIKVEWKSLLFDVAELVGQGLLVAPTAGGSLPDMLAKAFSVLKNVSASDPLETRAFGLFALSLAGAIDSLVPQRGNKPIGNVKDIGKKVSDALLAELGTGNHFLTRDFFVSPSECTLYAKVRQNVADLVSTAREQPVTEELKAKLDSAFAASIFNCWRARPDYFQPILESLENPGAKIAQLQVDWANYRAKLIENFTVRPVFGQMDYKASLSDLYLRLDATYKTESADGGFVQTRVNLHDDIDSWLDAGDPGDTIRLIFGGPGSGKSSFAKALAASLAARPDKRPIFVELQHANALGDLRQAIEQRLVIDQEIFSSDPISERDEHRMFVLIFDGLDELVVPGSAAASRVADGFVASLKALLRNLNSAGKCRAKVIVTGRTAIMQSFAKSLEVSNRIALEIKGFAEGGEAGEDLRPQWWAKFARAYRQDPSFPPALEAKELQEVTNEPLLCFLLALSGYLAGNWAEAADNTNRIYARLVGDVWERRWGQSELGETGRVGPGLNLRSREEFDLLMETLALAAWWGGENRVATKTSFDAALSATGASDIWTKFVADEGDGLSNLALTFYLRRSDIEGQGFEFTHKTFGEYLVARFLMKQATAKIALPLRARDIDKAEASERWCRYATQGAPHFGITSFLRNEARLMPMDAIDVSIEELQGWLSFVLDKGLPVHRRSNDDFRTLELMNDYGHSNIVSCISALSRAKDVICINEISDWNVKIEWPAQGNSVSRLLSRVSDIEMVGRSPDVDFYRFDFRSYEDIFGGIFLAEAYFEFTLWSDVTVVNTYFGGSNFEGAVFQGAYFLDVAFEDCDLTDVDFTEANLGGCSFRSATLLGACLDGANLNRTDIANAEMDYGWWNLVSLETFKNPPKGDPVIWKDGVKLNFGDKGYPKLPAIYSRKATQLKKIEPANSVTTGKAD